LDPTNYRVPNTTVTVSLEGMAPYGSPLPKNPLILALTFASAAADQVIQTLGDHALPGLWRYEEGEIGIDVYTQLSIDCNFSILEKGLMGLVDLITEPGGVGAVAAEFNFKEDGKGEVASGRLKLLKTHGPSTAGTKIPSASRIEQSRSTSVTLARDVAETGAVGTA